MEKQKRLSKLFFINSKDKGISSQRLFKSWPENAKASGLSNLLVIVT